MKALHQKDADVLSYVTSQEPQGAFLSKIANACQLSIQNAYRYAKKLIKKGLLRKDERGLYHITEQGSCQLNDFNNDTCSGKSVKLESIKQLNASAQEPGMPQAVPEQTTNLNAFRAHYLIFPTSYSRAEATLSSLSIPYKRTGNPKHPSYTLRWQGLSMRIGSKKLIVWGPSFTEPISITAEQIRAKALNININALTSFLAKTNIRVQETIGHQPIAFVAYYELAILNNDAIEQYGKKHGYVPLAYDASGKLTTWLDATPQLVIETNRVKNHEQLRLWGQGIEDGVIRPYMDEMQHRQDIAGLTHLAEIQIASQQSQLQHNEQIASQLSFFAANINTHVQWMYESLRASSENRKLPRKPKQLDEKQRRL